MPPHHAYRSAVIDEIVHRTGWTEREAANTVGDDLTDMMEDGLTPADAASEILLAAAEDS